MSANPYPLSVGPHVAIKKRKKSRTRLILQDGCLKIVAFSEENNIMPYILSDLHFLVEDLQKMSRSRRRGD